MAQVLFLRLDQAATPWPAVLCLVASSLTARLLSLDRGPWIYLGAPGLLVVCVLGAGQLRDTSWDGLQEFSETIHEVGQLTPWQPEENSQNQEIARLRLDNRTNLLFGLVFSGAKGNFESAKWPNLAWSLAGALMLASAAGTLGATTRWQWAIFFLCLGQPTSITQTSTLYQDGAMAGALAGVFAAFLRQSENLTFKKLLPALAALSVLILSKRFSVVLGLFLVPLLALGLRFRGSRRLPIWLLVAGAFVSLALPPSVPFIRTLGLKSERNPTGRLFYRALLILDPDSVDPLAKDGIHGGCGEVSSSSAVMFWRRHFSASKRADDHPSIKPPFWFTRPELDVFSDLTPDLRFGGYGPLYGTAVLLALIPGLMLLLSTSPPQAGWKWILVTCLVMIPITPSWWARWFPQGWWIPFAACVGFLCGPGEWQKKFRWGMWLARLGLVALGLNSVLILVFTVKGYVEAESIIRKQLAFAKSLPQPVAVHWERFGGARFWLDRENIQWRKEPLPLHPPTLRLYRTELDVAVAPEDMARLQKEHPNLAKILLKKNLLQAP